MLEILAKLGLSFTQVLPNFLRHLIAFSVRDREEGLSLGVGEFRHLIMVKRNTQSPGTFLVSPRPGRRPLSRREVARAVLRIRVDRASVGDFDFSRLPRSWSEGIG